MKLKKILKDIPSLSVKGSKDVLISGICANSKLVGPGNLFIAKRGKTQDGNAFISEAIAAGAVAVVTDIYNPALKDLVQIIYQENQGQSLVEAEAQLVANYYQNPSDDLFMVGITGTSGKTTTAFLVKHLLEFLHVPCGLIGSIEYIIGNLHYKPTHTTPDLITNNKLLREMLTQGCKAAVMEVTSHALDQGRTANIEYDAAIFTNLTGDHLDYHQDMHTYSQAKAKLFKGLKTNKKKGPKLAIVNVDDVWHEQVASACNAAKLTYGINNTADVQAKNIKLAAAGTSFELSYAGQTVSCHIPLVGRFNVYNSLAAACVGIHKGASLPVIAKCMQQFPAVPGRLEQVENPLGLKIFVDYSHKEDALRNVLETLREFKPARLFTVFGCGGDRDKTKRPKMAAVAEKYSDFTIVTTDNPRSEDPETIVREIIAGFNSLENFCVKFDRRQAIEKAIEMSGPDDIILIAGKGHETYQIFAHRTIEFDDRAVAKELCSRMVQAKL